MRGVCAPCRARGLPRSATNAITPGRAARSCTPPYATREQRAEVCPSVVLLGQGYPSDALLWLLL